MYQYKLNFHSELGVNRSGAFDASSMGNMTEKQRLPVLLLCFSQSLFAPVSLSCPAKSMNATESSEFLSFKAVKLSFFSDDAFGWKLRYQWESGSNCEVSS